MPLTEIAALDAILDAHAGDLGDDFTPYRHHCYRVANLCLSQVAGGPDEIEKIAIATAFHDMGIWTDGTFDYLPPSVRLATAYLTRSGKAAWTAEISEMIFQHHKISRYRGDKGSPVEAFRRSDWADVTRGVVTFGLSRKLVRELYATWPDAGFHKMLARLELKRLRTHPLSPLPMVKL
jgi:hypothetical protein